MRVMRGPEAVREPEKSMSPIVFPHIDPTTGELVDVEYFSVWEVADRLHVSARTVQRRVHASKWPHLRVQGRIYMNGAQIARAVELMTVDPTRHTETDENT